MPAPTNPLATFEEDNVPLAGNRCKKPGCTGEVVAQCVGLFRGNYLFSTPACEKCKRTYFNAGNVRKIGIEEFTKSLQDPMTI